MSCAVGVLGIGLWAACLQPVAGAAGAGLSGKPAPGVVTIRVNPERWELSGNLARLQLLVIGVTADERRRDLTCEASYESLTPGTLAVSSTGEVRPVADGEGTVRVSHTGRAIEVSVKVRGVEARPKVSFREDVIPILNKAGCNGGSCHGAQYGQAGFKLSLLGYAPEQDHGQLARDWMQRRVSRVRPEDSLILCKPTLQIPHGGGRRFEVDSYEYQVLTTWIAGGLPGLVRNEPQVVGLEVSPGERVYEVGQGQQLRVVARYSDGTVRDVTGRAQYDSLGDSIATVTPGGYLTAVSPGQAAVMVRYLGQAKVSMVISPYAKAVDLAEFKPNNFVDELVQARWQRLGLEPSGLCTDTEFIRRASLDAIGTLPRPEKIRAFLASDELDKRTVLVDELLGLSDDPQRNIYGKEWSAYWTLKWGDLLRNNRNAVGDGGMWALYNWIRQSLRENKPVDKFVREIITAQGSIFQNGPANYFRIARTPQDLAETTAQVFLGVRLQCARCHHHPFEVYSQADYYGLASFFTRVGTKGSNDFGPLGGDSVVLVKSSGEIRHPRTGQVVRPAPLLGKPIDSSQVRDRRGPLANWISSPDNPLFARNLVNRFWGYFMGSGLVEPIDDQRATNPPSNPELLDALAVDFVKGGYDLKHLMRVIMTSRAYQLSSRPTEANASDTRFYTHYNVKRLSAEVLLDAIDFACGTRERFAGVPLGTRAIELPDSNFTSYFLDTLGRPKRVIACECERTGEPNLAQVLHVANGELLGRKLTDRKGRIARLLQEKHSDEEIVTELYLCSASRPPTTEEISACKEIIARAPHRREGIEDVLWALCNTREFLFNH